jgi:hypothetical protein
MGQGGDGTAGPNMTGIYSLCKIDVDITPYCSTKYTAGGSGGRMEALCGDPNASDEDPDAKPVGKMAYINSMTNATVERGIANWRDVGTDWSNSLSLGTGLSDGEASNSRLLMQLQLVPAGGLDADPNNLDVKLNDLLPSMSEAIAVLSGCTLLKSFIDAPFVPFWVSGSCFSLQHVWFVLADNYRTTLKACSRNLKRSTSMPQLLHSNMPLAVWTTLPKPG